ncbi:YceI family protein [Intrasporangium calvum]|uniref:YceI family protein n=1 Tax=Intrasporangium calvum (strain ATCC 23552 / DSM 43043 / JCM 3097 / NBRC 12989 / NCIMB 10167 / NRRL B-3866 / 7 KIP) TaxID=710696 RepID=E6SC21_INTC7|nr:YceI family protein [Intrasporangium calvum]ADU49561.1 YceI family protein [Intrasporangium calvum DSM 43043]
MADDSTLSGNWELDPAHTRIGFSARHAMVTTVRGSFNDVQGYFHADLDDMSKSNARVILKAASVDTRNNDRDNHLRSADFFDVERFPDITFESTQIEEVGDGAYVVSGHLTIRDITKPVTIPIELLGVQTDAFGALRAGFEGTRRINRRDYGLEWNMPLDKGGVLVSERITLEFEISAVQTAPEGAGDQAGQQDQHEGDPHQG